MCVCRSYWSHREIPYGAWEALILLAGSSQETDIHRLLAGIVSSRR